ncbi:ComF family protein [Lacinutrix jangbogonensis]|uniref:ComF family protein n=1 Tax=Lacinutrix jangbogonensis TaxID=1469557 RepID=UPI00053D186F|nr:phosphoribosyltransferase family protein [Lacinutrix jangbogonensis]
MFKALVNIFFPEVCLTCQLQLIDNEKHLCTSCRHKLPLTNYHLTQDPFISKLFYGRAKIERGTALLRFEKKGITQQLIHQLKYREQQQVGTFLGAWLGTELNNCEDYSTIDLVIPVPLHKKKLRSRGYNQVSKFGEELASALKADYIDDVLIKVTNTTSQVSKNRFSRWTGKNDLFALSNTQKIAGKHILLVDDIITTGATLEACMRELNKAKNIKISIATMAIA